MIPFYQSCDISAQRLNKFDFVLQTCSRITAHCIYIRQSSSAVKRQHCSGFFITSRNSCRRHSRSLCLCTGLSYLGMQGLCISILHPDCCPVVSANICCSCSTGYYDTQFLRSCHIPSKSIQQHFTPCLAILILVLPVSPSFICLNPSWLTAGGATYTMHTGGTCAHRDRHQNI